MRKLIVIFFISFFFVSCEDDILPTVYNLELRYDGDRLEFSRISLLSNPASSPALPEHAFDFNLNNQSFEIYGLKNTIDVYVTVSFFCTADGENHTKEVKADFYEDRTTVLLIERVIGCEPTIQVIYE